MTAVEFIRANGCTCDDSKLTAFAIRAPHKVRYVKIHPGVGYSSSETAGDPSSFSARVTCHGCGAVAYTKERFVDCQGDAVVSSA